MTLRELFWLAEAARREAWQHTAWLSAMIANANRDPHKKPSPFQPDDFNPLVQRDRKASAVVVDEHTIGDLRAMFVGGDGGVAGGGEPQKVTGPAGPER